MGTLKNKLVASLMIAVGVAVGIYGQDLGIPVVLGVFSLPLWISKEPLM